MSATARWIDSRPTSARWVLPPGREPVAWGRIEPAATDADAVTEGRPEHCELPLFAVVPPLVNAHTHLDLSQLATPIAPGRSLPDWLPEVVRSRTADPLAAIRTGYSECRDTGTAFLADVTTVDEPLNDLDGRFAFREYLGCNPDRWDSIAESATAFLSTHPDAGLSPHATYSVPLPLLRRLVEAAGSQPVMMHVAEDPSERELLRSDRGPFRTMLERLEVYRPDLFGGQTMSDVLAELLRSPRPIIAHGNDLTPAEIEQLGEHENVIVVWCPRTHAAFKHSPHPVAELRRRGIRVAIGTDSRASTPTLSMLDELRAAYHARPDLDASDLLTMATEAGATMLGVNLRSSWVALPLVEPDAPDWPTALFGSRKVGPPKG